jgi:molybdopterin converting factor small subunit
VKADELRARLKKRAGAFERVFSSPDGQEVLRELEDKFNGNTLRVNKENGTIDVYASIAASGCRQVLLYIQDMRSLDATTE